MNRTEVKTTSKQDQEEKRLSNLLRKIGQSDIPEELLSSCAFKIFVELNHTIENLNQKIGQLSDITRKISEIHALHFPKDALEKENNLTEKFLAEILLGMPRKRKK